MSVQNRNKLFPPAPHLFARIYLLDDCPIAREYAPEIRRICQEYTRKHVAFEIVHEDRDETDSKARAFAEEYGYTVPFRIDRDGALARAAHVVVSPSAALFLGNKILYSGRIDDAYPAIGAPRRVPKRRDLRIALDEALAGKSITLKKTNAIGCIFGR